MTVQDWLQWLPTIICVLMAVGVFAGRNWLKARIERSVQHTFDAKIAAIKHEQGIELGKLQSELDHLKDRGVRSNEREYQAVSSVWEGFVDAFLATKRSVGQFLSFPDLTKLAVDDVMEFLRGECFTEQHARRVVGADDRNAAYATAIRARRIDLAGDAVMKAINLLQKQCVFVPDALAVQFEKAIAFVSDARVEQYVVQKSPDIRELRVDRSIALVGEEGTQMFGSLRDAVRDRLLRSLNEGEKADTETKAN
jgi:hypothetical protein